MRPSRDLLLLRDRAVSYAIRLRAVALAASLSPSRSDADKLLSYVAVELLNLWREFARSFYLSCTIRPRRGGGGRVLMSNFASISFDDAIAEAIKIFDGRRLSRRKPDGTFRRRDEPDWNRTDVLEASCLALGTSNQIQIRNAFAIPSTVFTRLPTVRNFYGHRNETTARAAVALAPLFSMPAQRHPNDLLRARAYGRPQALIVDWVDETAQVIDYICE